jgi:hypothetical protein
MWMKLLIKSNFVSMNGKYREQLQVCIKVLLCLYLLISFFLHGLVSVSSEESFEKSSNRLWNEMSQLSQTTALLSLKVHFRQLLTNLQAIQHESWVAIPNCKVQLVGSGWGAHQLCTNTIPFDNCTFFSFGISNDHSFDTHLARKWRCRGFAADPTIKRKSKIHPIVSFHNIAAKTLKDNTENWWIASVPSLLRCFELSFITVLKMDCEGCGTYVSGKELYLQ